MKYLCINHRINLIMEPESLETKNSNLSSNDIKKLVENREKAKQYIKSCKEIIAKQSDQLKAQQAEFKESLSSLESQQYNSRFHAVGIKLELESHKIYMIVYKKYRLLLASGLYKFRYNNSIKNPVKKYVPIELRSAIKRFTFNFKKNYVACMGNAWRKLRNSAGDNSEKILQEIVRIEKENKELKFKIAKSKIKTEVNPAIQELAEENKSLKEKIQNSEESVELFIKEMSNLLDKHETPGFREEIEKLALKNKRSTRINSKNKSKNSPERAEVPRKSMDRKLHCD